MGKRGCGRGLWPSSHKPQLKFHRISCRGIILQTHKSFEAAMSVSISMRTDGLSQPEDLLDQESEYVSLSLPYPDKIQDNRTRCIAKDGAIQFEATNVPASKILHDGFTSLLEIKWRWAFFLFCFMYFGSWTFFAGLWHLILYIHGDLDHFDESDWRPCVAKINSFARSFLFSVETQHTTGYGYHELTDECPEAIILFCVQSIVGLIIEGAMVGLIFARIIRAKRRRATLAFSKTAVICERDGQLTFMFRVGDLRTKSNVLQTHIRAQVIRNKITKEGEVISCHQEELKLNGSEPKAGKSILLWPTVISHTIDNSSALFHIHPSDLTGANQSFEIIVVMEGVVESTGLLVQARTSYLPGEILWGQRFQDLASSNKASNGERLIDFSKFHETYAVVTSRLSAAEMCVVTS